MRSEKPSIGQIKSIRIVASGMIRGSIQRVKAVPFGLYIGTIGQSKPQPAENSDGTVLQKGQRMHTADPKRRSRQRFVNTDQRLRLGGCFQCRQTLIQFALLKMAKTTSDPKVAAGLIDAAADLKDQAGEVPPSITTEPPDGQTEP